MPCASCGAENPPGTKFCANCGTALGAPAPVQGQAPAQPQSFAQPGQPQGFGGTVVPQGPRPQSSISIDFRRLGIGDMIAIGGSVLLFISLFLTWYSGNASDQFGTTASGSTSALGSGAGGWRVLILVLDILILLYLFVRTMTPRGFHLPLPHWQLLTVFLGLQFLLTLLAFLVKPSLPDGLTGSIGWGYGAFIGLVASIIALAGGIMRRSEPEVVVPGVPHGGFGSFRATPQPPQAGVTPGGGAQGILCGQCGTAVAPGTPYCTTCGAPVQG